MQDILNKCYEFFIKSNFTNKDKNEEAFYELYKIITNRYDLSINPDLKMIWEFLKFLDENSEIQKSFDAPNLFIPRDDHGLSILPDQNSSYNFLVTKMIWDYMTVCKERKINVSVKGLCNFIAKYNCLTPEINDKCNESDIEEFKNMFIGKLSSIPDSELLQFMNKRGKGM